MAFASTVDVLMCEVGDPDASSIGVAVNFESEDHATDLPQFVFDICGGRTLMEAAHQALAAMDGKDCFIAGLAGDYGEVCLKCLRLFDVRDH
jgi:hypothetical protein